MNLRLYISFIIIGLLMVSCEKEENTPPPTPQTPQILDNVIIELFEKGFNMRLNQIYVINEDLMGDDSRWDSIFNGTQSFYNIPNFMTNNSRKAILANREPNEIWNVSPLFEHIHHYEAQQSTIYERAGLPQFFRWNDITCVNSIDTMKFLIQFRNDAYNKFSRDTEFGVMRVFTSETDSYELLNYIKKISSLTDSYLQIPFGGEETNLHFSVPAFDGKSLILMTNPTYGIGQIYSAPLTSNQVKIEIANNNYELVSLNDGKIVAYKIGENFYIPRYGDSYVYYGTSNANGVFDSYSRITYLFDFTIM